jgi:hypothetical protein
VAGTFTLQKLGVTLPAGEWVIVLAAELLHYPDKTFHVHNVGSGIVTDGEVQASPVALNAPDAQWETIDTGRFQNLPVDTMKSYQISSGSRRFLRLRLRSIDGSTVDVYITANG